MDRRQALRLLAASAFALGSTRPALAASGGPRKVVVIGAGILGAAIGYELAKRGAEVTILDRTGPAAGATGNSFAYLNASTKASSRPYFGLNWLGMAGWRAWQQEPGAALPLRWGGAVYWRGDAAATQQLAASLGTVRGWGYSGQAVDGADIRRLVPSVTVSGDPSGAFFPEEGSVDPAEAVAALLARARQLGARTVFPAEVIGLIVAGGQVRGVRTREGGLTADAVVLAAGLGSGTLAQSLGVPLPLTSSPGILVHTRPQPPLLDRLVFAPHSTIRQTVDGRIVSSSSGHEGGGGTGDPAAIGQAILAGAADYLPQIRDAAIERVTIGQRVLPGDGFPIVGFVPKVDRLYVAVTHSGVTLAPVLGRWAATEILDGARIDLLDSFRPARFAA
ncbi:NAD(P)/FAD-dependent oxidoreductase [Rhizorhabdus histidinilytica]|jgi:glycine/D-amino acid oxidase-like deaminating enzyme|uniref:Glycine/D-amino acid oxidase n=1 Tax=Rhizorhabdus histidinilytica TaxID=439228 RepID=A0A1T5AMJ2_9SPHN|nr:FAD-binding oxidoreductase [Rhizorhabdus histidinilytica]QEH79742.1 FAD-binding oxidoreductase [Sphingomonas sp. C8-2]SKB36251.1 Glycine/D-amino acid oxidase [Rhizorhabdus histidinilytica]